MEMGLMLVAVVDVFRVLNLSLIHIFSNASDALEKLRVKQLTDSNIYQPDKPLEISITTDKDNKTITIADTGIGMTEADLVEMCIRDRPCTLAASNA